MRDAGDRSNHARMLDIRKVKVGVIGKIQRKLYCRLDIPPQARPFPVVYFPPE